jgi:shikimate dehydrogenase
MIRPVIKDLYAVIGNPVAHSLSPIMMNAVFEALKIPALYFALQVDEPGADLVTLARLGIKGLSVTIPYKEAACRFAERVDEAAQTMGAVNTLRLDETRWQGQNTDWIGAISALRQAVDPSDSSRSRTFLSDHADPPPQANAPALYAGVHRQSFIAGKRALVIGAGGVARAVIYGLRREGATVTISNRGIARGENLAQRFACDFIPLSELSGKSTRTVFDIIVQCTSVGLMDKEDFTLISDSLFHPGSVVMDTVYRPLWTPFLRKAKAADCVTVSGLEMLLHQGVAQLEWWLGEIIRSDVVVPIMREAVMGFLEDE